MHVLDLAPLDGSDPVANHATVEAELREHGHGLADLPRILCLSKADLVPPDDVGGGAARVGAARPACRCWPPRPRRGRASRAARRDLRARAREEQAEPRRGEQPATHRVYRPGAGDSFSVERVGPGAFRVEGGRIDRLIARHDIENAEALRYVEERLRALGVIRALEAAGFTPGDDVEIAGVVFELDPG